MTHAQRTYVSRLLFIERGRRDLENTSIYQPKRQSSLVPHQEVASKLIMPFLYIWHWACEINNEK